MFRSGIQLPASHNGFSKFFSLKSHRFPASNPNFVVSSQPLRLFGSFRLLGIRNLLPLHGVKLQSLCPFIAAQLGFVNVTVSETFSSRFREVRPRRLTRREGRVVTDRKKKKRVVYENRWLKGFGWRKKLLRREKHRPKDSRALLSLGPLRPAIPLPPSPVAPSPPPPTRRTAVDLIIAGRKFNIASEARKHAGAPRP